MFLFEASIYTYAKSLLSQDSELGSWQWESQFEHSSNQDVAHCHTICHRCTVFYRNGHVLFSWQQAFSACWLVGKPLQLAHWLWCTGHQASQCKLGWTGTPTSRTILDWACAGYSIKFPIYILCPICNLSILKGHVSSRQTLLQVWIAYRPHILCARQVWSSFPLGWMHFKFRSWRFKARTNNRFSWFRFLDKEEASGTEDSVWRTETVMPKHS